MARFVGTYTPKLDDKGRLTLPAKFRDALAGGVMVTRSQDRSLSVYRVDEFDVIADKAVQASSNDPEARAFIRYYFAGAVEGRLDAQGRVNLSAEHREYASLAKECVVIGMYDHLEIWDAQKWRDYQAAHEEAFSNAGSAALDAIL